ncbi:DNA-protecting protein DprA [Beggiatoa leptomitoformis]|uniref:DNA-protecting protein DprA n=2 Tax=Beggiatoa leptomitoformis TaxID=288004 RepID=A0A2N9YFM5_9GAMM|nr:DNA-protecting protein DprA [Beggiatoa leptomitoformis]AUI69185.2 DNA-protecting protein DprA [Beggiatoa leptomitoformis]
MRFLKYFGSPHAALMGGRNEWATLGVKGELLQYLENPDKTIIEKDLHWLSLENNHLVTLNDPHYPHRLCEIHDPPPILFVHGDYTLLSSQQVAMVGTRNPSPLGKEIAYDFAKNLSQAGFTITSGLAMGIDAYSHQGALAATGRTIAVAGTGLDRVYPAQNRELAHQIAQTGALISELPPGTPAKNQHFPRRNRIISGLSIGTLVVEASLRSGSLITARQAVEQGRDVFAIPGSIHNPLAKGCHALIKEGAKLVETAADVMEELFLHLPNQQRTIPLTPPLPVASNRLTQHNELDGDYIRLLEYLCTEAQSIDNLVELSGLTAEAVSSMLLILELQGLIASQAGGLYVRLS